MGQGEFQHRKCAADKWDNNLEGNVCRSLWWLAWNGENKKEEKQKQKEEKQQQEQLWSLALRSAWGGGAQVMLRNSWT